MKRDRKPDTRLNWRDPDMPLLKLGYRNDVLVLFEVPPYKVQQHYEMKMRNHPAPTWKNDPSYNWRRKK